jgi:two-component system chemotaxis sensor kinase CheA
LIHLLRNCVDHGIESPDTRTRKGKNARGTVSITVSQIGVSKVEILVADDGGGVNRAAVVAAAVKKGVLSEQEAHGLDDQAATALIFQSDVSTSVMVTDLSGRGLGMAIVREKVERLGGQVWVETTSGQGTTFRILLPLTLATFRGFFVETGGETFVIPTINVERVVRMRPTEIKVLEGVETLMLNGKPIGVARLHKVLDIPVQEHVDSETGFLRGLVLTSGDRRVLFCVDQIVNEQEALFKTLGTYLDAVPHVAGVTVLGSGKVVPIIDVPNLVRTAIEGTAGQSTARVEVMARPMGKRAVLLVEDSVTSRMLLKGILESAGYEVTTAIDGMDALGQLGRRNFDLVVSDVEMPRMNGFELTAQLRTQEKHLHLPVVLVTGLESPKDRARGMEAGASAYIVKGDFTQNDLLSTVQRFIPAMAA